MDLNSELLDTPASPSRENCPAAIYNETSSLGKRRVTHKGVTTGTAQSQAHMILASNQELCPSYALLADGLETLFSIKHIPFDPVILV